MYESKEKKEYVRSIRMTKTVQKYVEKQEGNGFNQKFENMVLFCMKRETDLKKRIAQHEKSLDELNKRISATQSIVWDIEKMKNQVQAVIRTAENIVEESEGK